MALPFGLVTISRLWMRGGRGARSLHFALSDGKSGPSAMHILDSFEVPIRAFIQIGLLLIVPVCLAVLAPKNWLISIRERYPEVLSLATIVVTCWGMFSVLHLPMNTQYKFAAAGSLAFALLIAPMVECAWQAHPRSTISLLTVALLPAFCLITEPHLGIWGTEDAIYAEGSILRSMDPEEDEVMRFLQLKTELDSMVIDSHLSVPMLGHRSMFIGLDIPRIHPQSAARFYFDGWGMPPWLFLEHVTGADLKAIERRRALASQVYADGKLEQGWGKQVIEEAKGRDVYVIARNKLEVDRMSVSQDVVETMKLQNLAVYHVVSRIRTTD